MKFSMQAPSCDSFINTHKDFLGYLASFRENRPRAQWSDLLEYAGSPEKIAVVCVDLIKGFCTAGPLFSTRVNDMALEVGRIITDAHDHGVENFLFTCDCHEADSLEFKCFPAHCIAGTTEAELDDSMLVLPPVDKYIIIPKTSINSFIDTTLISEIEKIQPRVVVAMGDATDLCYYQLASNFRMFANARHWDCRVIAPLCAIETYDLPVDAALSMGHIPHDGDFLNAFFAYHLQLIGVETVKDID